MEDLSHRFITIQTGPWEGAKSWLYKISCPACGWEDLATNYEDSVEAMHDHRKEMGAAPLLPRRKKNIPDVEWEDF